MSNHQVYALELADQHDKIRSLGRQQMEDYLPVSFFGQTMGTTIGWVPSGDNILEFLGFQS